MVTVKHNEIPPKDFRELQVRSGRRASSEKAAIGAIKNSIFTVGVYHDTKLVAFGRVCGDNHLYFLICDFIVDQNYTDDRYKMLIVKEIDDFLRLADTKDSQVMVMVDRPLDEMFAKLGFKYFDEDYQLVMIR